MAQDTCVGSTTITSSAAATTVPDLTFDKADVVIVGADLFAWSAAAQLANLGMKVAVVDHNADPSGSCRHTLARLEHPFDDSRRGLLDRELELRHGFSDPVPAPLPLLLLGRRDECERAHRRLGGIPALETSLIAPSQIEEMEPQAGSKRWACMVQGPDLVSPRHLTDACRALAEANGVAVWLADRAPTLLWQDDTTTCAGVRLGEVGLIVARQAVLVAAGGETASVIGAHPDRVLRTSSWAVSLELNGPEPNHELAAVTTLDTEDIGTLATGFSLVPTLRGQSSVLGSTFSPERRGFRTSRRDLVARGAPYYGGVQGAPVNVQRTYARPKADDGLPLVGEVAGAERLFVVTAGDVRDYTIAAALAELAVDSIMAGSPHGIPGELRARRLGWGV